MQKLLQCIFTDILKLLFFLSFCQISFIKLIQYNFFVEVKQELAEYTSKVKKEVPIYESPFLSDFSTERNQSWESQEQTREKNDKFSENVIFVFDSCCK